MVFALPVNIYEIEHFIIIVCPAFNINENSFRIAQHIRIYSKWTGGARGCDGGSNAAAVAVGGRHSNRKLEQTI